MFEKHGTMSRCGAEALRPLPTELLPIPALVLSGRFPPQALTGWSVLSLKNPFWCGKTVRSSRLRSGGEQCHTTLAVEVWRGTLPAEARG